ncbi:MAG: hypothetical protein KC615_03525, partial [Anaerolineae bacterium]|nr:hypothetical protein [Anaerolineae bacterium]
STNAVELIWQTDKILDSSMRLFVQVFAENNLLAVSDGIPVNYTRPTTSWSTSEYIITHHSFELGLSSYQLHIGWYDPLTSERVPLENDSDTLLISP